MKKTPTSEEFFLSKSKELISDSEDMPKWMIEAAIEFAKLHVEEAVKEITEKAKAYPRSNGEWVSSTATAFIDKQSIIDAYPLTNII